MQVKSSCMEKRLIIKNQLAQLAHVATYVEELCAEMGAADDIVFALNLVLEEAVSNVIMYAYPQGGEHDITITSTYTQGMLTITVQDDGIAFDPTQAPEVDVTLTAEERPIGGLGIHLMRQLTDEVAYRRMEGHNILTIRKNI